MAPADLQQCEAQLEVELAIKMPQAAAGRLALEELMRQELVAALGIEPERLESMQIIVADPLSQYKCNGLLTFARAHSDIHLRAGGAEATKVSTNPADQLTWRAAAAAVVMHSGKHFAEFTVVEGWDLFFGLVRPTWDVEGGKNPQDEPEHCFFYALNGARYPGGSQEWVGVRGLDGRCGRVGLMIDLDVGSMTAYINGHCAGLLVVGEQHVERRDRERRRVLQGEYCWAVSMRHGNDTVRIEKLEP